MKTIALSLLVASLSWVGLAAETKIECTISADRTTYMVGEVPIITVSITNKSDQEIVLVGSLDGSAEGMRLPMCRLEIYDDTGKPVESDALRCGNMNELNRANFVVVPAGGSFNPFGDGFFPPPLSYQFPITKPGYYSVRFEYSTIGGIQEYFGDERLKGQKSTSREIMRLFKRVPQLKLKSKELKLKFEAQS